MSDYQRFVSYLYEYQNNQKKANCGFARVEVRNHICKLEIHMKLPPYPFTPSFQVYAFIPEKERLLGIPLGKAGCQHGIVYASFQLPDRNIGGLDCSIQDLGGVLIQSDNDQIFATAWKELSIRPDLFFLPDNEPQIKAASLESASPETVSPESASLEPAPDLLPEETPPDVSQPSSSSEAALRRQELFARYPQVHPFFDDEIHSCIRLSPNELPDLQNYSLYIGNNPFLNHSIQSYQHILLGKMDRLKENEYLLAIPGVYDEKERFLAAMFGFPNFKPAAGSVIRPGQFGYWYRILY